MSPSKPFLLIASLIIFLFSLFSFTLNAQTSNPWVGVWNSSYGPMTLIESGGVISGTYIRSNGELGKISNGVVSGNKLTGRWSEPETYLPPWDAGDIEFTLNEDKVSFNGKWRWDQGSIWWGWTGTKGFSINGKIELGDGTPFSNCQVELIQNNKIIKQMSSNSSGTFSFQNLQPGTYQVRPYSSDYQFNPIIRTVTLENKSVTGIDFKVSNTFYITILYAGKSIAYNQEVELTAEIKNATGNYINEQHVIEFSVINPKLGSFNPSDGLVTTTNGKATIKYKAPSKEQAGTAGYIYMVAKDKNITTETNYTILKIPFELEVWAEPKDPGLAGNAKIAIIPADEQFPALLSAKCFDNSGNPQASVPIKFSIDVNSQGTLYSGELNSKTITVNTNEKGIAEAYYKYQGSYTGTKITDEVIIENMNDGRTGVVKVEVGLGLVIYKKERYQSQPGVIASDIGQNIVFYVQSKFHPNLDLQSYSVWAEMKVWKGKEIGVYVSIERINKPVPGTWDKFISIPEDVVYKGKCSMDNLGNKNILYAIGNPSYDIGNNHMLPQIIPKSQGAHLYKIAVHFIDSRSGNSGNETVMINYPLLGFEVDREKSWFEDLTCALSPSTSLQLYGVEGVKIFLALKFCEKFAWIGDVIAISNIICKVMEGDKLEAVKALANYLGGKYVDAKAEEYKKLWWLKVTNKSEYNLIQGALIVKDGVDWIQRVDSDWKIKAEEGNQAKLNKGVLYSDNVNTIEFQDLANQFFISYLSGAQIDNLRVVTVFNASESKIVDNTGKQAPLIDNETNNLSNMVFYNRGNFYTYLLDVNSTFNLEFLTDKNFAVSICDPLKSTYTLYNVPNSQSLKAKLILNNSNNPLQIDYGNNGSIDENKSAEIITPGQSSGGSNKLTYDWTFQAGGNGFDTGSKIKIIDDNNILFGGSFDKTLQVGTKNINSKGGYDFFISSLTKTKNVNWTYAGGSNGFDNLSDLAVDKSGDILFTGYITGAASYDGQSILEYGGTDAYLIKASSIGRVKWAYSYGGTGDEYGNCIGVDGSNNYYIAGTFVSSQIKFGSATLQNGGMKDIFLVKLASNGNALWAKSIKGSLNQNIYSMHVYDDGTVLVAGTFKDDLIIQNTTLLSSTNSEDLFLAKFTKDGDLIWAKQFGGNGTEYPHDLKVDGEGNILLTGCFTSSFSWGGINLTSKGWEDVFLAKLNSIGNPVWIKIGGSSGTDVCYSIISDAGNNIIIAGKVGNPAQFDTTPISCSQNTTNSFLIRYDKAGNISATSGPAEAASVSSNIVTDLEIDKDGSYYMLGVFEAPVTFNTKLTSNGYQDIFLVKYRPSTPTNIKEPIAQQLPNDFCFYQNYPNPFNPETIIKYELPKQEFVTLKVYDNLGREVATLVNKEQIAGRYEVKFSSIKHNLASGVYIYQLRTNNFVQTRKMLLIK